MFTITYTTEDYEGRTNSSYYTEDTYQDARQSFMKVCSSLRTDFYNYCYCKFSVTLMENDELIDRYGLSDMND